MITRGEQRGAEAPGPHSLALILVRSLAHVAPGLSGPVAQQLPPGLLHRLTDRGDDRGQLTPCGGRADHVAEELAGGAGRYFTARSRCARPNWTRMSNSRMERR